MKHTSTFLLYQTCCCPEQENDCFFAYNDDEPSDHNGCYHLGLRLITTLTGLWPLPAGAMVLRALRGPTVFAKQLGGGRWLCFFFLLWATHREPFKYLKWLELAGNMFSAKATSESKVPSSSIHIFSIAWASPEIAISMKSAPRVEMLIADLKRSIREGRGMRLIYLETGRPRCNSVF